MKTFNFRNGTCGLIIEHYNKDTAMAISITDLELDEQIECLTVIDYDFDYDIGLVTTNAGIVTGNEIDGYKTGTEILAELGVIEKIWESYDFYNRRDELVKTDVCSINIRKLKEYAIEWDYWETEIED